jgi:ATP-dependent RNA helicase RhlE
LTNPAKVEVTPPSSTVDKIEQQLFFVSKKEKADLLLHLLSNPAIKSTLVFTRTKHGADKVAKLLQRSQIRAAAIHGNKSQNARQNALADFKNGTLRVLVATDIAARGIDIDELSYVINYDLPDVPETYVHRIGRTGRAGNEGIALSFCSAEEREELRDIQKLIGKQIPVINDHPFTANANQAAPPPQERPARTNFRNQQGEKRQEGNRQGGNRQEGNRQGGNRQEGNRQGGNRGQQQRPGHHSTKPQISQRQTPQPQTTKQQTPKPSTPQPPANRRMTLEQWEEAERW